MFFLVVIFYDFVYLAVFYFLLIIVWMVFITLWFVGTQIKSNDFIWALPVSFFIILLMGLTYLAARIGRKKGSKEEIALKKGSGCTIERIDRATVVRASHR